jgi:hypothetical protein
VYTSGVDGVQYGARDRSQQRQLDVFVDTERVQLAIGPAVVRKGKRSV